MAEETPLQVVLKVMKTFMDAGEHLKALAAARAAAPYVHGRVGVKRVRGSLAEVPDDELEFWEEGDDGEDAAGESSDGAG